MNIFLIEIYQLGYIFVTNQIGGFTVQTRTLFQETWK